MELNKNKCNFIANKSYSLQIKLNENEQIDTTSVRYFYNKLQQ